MCDKSKLTAELHEHIVFAIATGAKCIHAAQAAGISYKTFMRWMVRGKLNKDAVHGNFYRSVIQARSKILCQAQQVLLHAMSEGDYRAAALLIKLLLNDDYEEEISKHLTKTKK